MDKNRFNIYCEICEDTKWVTMINTYTKKEFIARCTCSIVEGERFQPYTAFIKFSPEKFILLSEYEKTYGINAPPIKDSELADIIVSIVTKAERRQDAQVPF